jgi:hypothetical protein
LIFCATYAKDKEESLQNKLICLVSHSVAFILISVRSEKAREHTYATEISVSAIFNKNITLKMLFYFVFPH